MIDRSNDCSVVIDKPDSTQRCRLRLHASLLQRISSAERIATTASSAALASATHRSKTAIENFDEQIIHYREKKSPVPHSMVEPDYMKEHRSALLQACSIAMFFVILGFDNHVTAR